MAKQEWIGIFKGNTIPGYKIKKVMGDIVDGCEGVKLGIVDKKFEKIVKGRHIKGMEDFEETFWEKLIKNAKIEMIGRAIEMGANAVINVDFAEVSDKKGNKQVLVTGDPVVLSK